jgi:putative exosortase-associated protein (TIGR04073 family)
MLYSLGCWCHNRCGIHRCRQYHKGGFTISGADAEVKVKVAPEPTGDVYASTTKGPYYSQNLYELKARKFMRGVANVTLCPAEIPNQMFREAYKSSPGSGAFVGIFKGIWKGTQRFAIGTWEIVTFYYPGNNNYQPFIQPEVVFMDESH